MTKSDIERTETNLSTEHQPEGAAGNPSDTLNRNGAASGEHPSAGRPGDTAQDRQNATWRSGGEAKGGIAAKAGDPTSPAAADARATGRDEEQARRGFGDDGAASNPD